MTYIGFYLPNTNASAGYWATVTFDPRMKLKILGVSNKQVQAIKKQPIDPNRKIIGEWIQEEQPFSGHITIYTKNNELFMEKVHTDGSAGIDKIVERSTAQGRRFMHEKRTGPKHDYYLLDRLGNLQLWSMDIDGSFVLVTTAKKK